MSHFVNRLEAMRFRDSKKDQIEKVLKGKFQFFVYVVRDWHTNKYLAEIDVYSNDFVLNHKEPIEEYPSDHLMTKLILLIG